MLPNRTHLSLLTGLLVLLAAVPVMGDDLRDLQLWAPAETGPYGNGPQPAEGFFFTFDQMFWYITKPTTQVIGRPGDTRVVYYEPDHETIQGNSHDTGMLGAPGITGSQRYEIGRIIDRWGWFVSAFDLHNQNQEAVLQDASVVFEDPSYGAQNRRYLQGYYIDDPTTDPVTMTGLVNLPVDFETLAVTNRTKLWNVELNGMYRTKQMHHGGFFEFFAGARYMELNDQFTVEGISHRDFDPADRAINRNNTGWTVGTPDYPADGDDDDTVDLYDEYGYRVNSQGERLGFATQALGDSLWDTEADNHVIGPQIGVRWFRQHGRWRLSGEGRFFAGINNQNVHQSGYLGSNLNAGTAVSGLPAYEGQLGFNNYATEVEFSPAWEVRLNLHYQFTRAISFKTGWTGFWIDSIARGSALVDYQIHDTNNAFSSMGINMANNRQSVFAHGFNIGIEVNR